MDEMPRQKLVELIRTHGPAVIDDQRRCQGLLRDYLGAHKRELKLIIMALEEDIPRDIFLQVIHLHGKSENQQITKNILPQNLLLSKFSQRMIDNLSITSEAAQWTVEAWALALNFIFQEELSGNPIANPATPATKTMDLQPIVASDGRPTLIVARFGGGQYKTIGEALKAAAPGMRIIIKPGLYKEALVLDKAIEIVGDGQLEEIVIEETTCIRQISDQIRIQNVTLRGSLLLDKGQTELFGCQVIEGIKVNGDSTQFIARNCKINRVHADKGTINLEECDILNSNLWGVSNVTIIKSSVDIITIGSQYKKNFSLDLPKFITILDQCKVGEVIITEGNPRFTNCTLIAVPKHVSFGPSHARIVTISSGGSGVFENCDFSGQKETPAIFILGNGAPVFRQCKVHGLFQPGTVGYGRSYSLNKANLDSTNYNYQNIIAGIFFGEDSEGLVDGCDIRNNEIGIEIARGGNPIIKGSNLTQNSEYGIAVHDNGAGIVEGCNLTNNNKGAFNIEPGCFTRKENNKE